jgi:hypothetical protein
MSAFAQTGRKALSIEAFLPGINLPSGAALKEAYMGRQITGDAVNDEIKTAFEKKYPDASNSDWYGLNKRYTRFGVRFNDNDQCAVAVFTKQGYLIYSASPIAEDQLSQEDRNLVNTTFSKYDIVSVMELTVYARLMWIVEMHDASYNTIFVHVEDGTVEEINHYDCKKARYRKKYAIPYSIK